MSATRWPHSAAAGLNRPTQCQAYCMATVAASFGSAAGSRADQALSSSRSAVAASRVMVAR
jgi:hypothetical protein